MKNIIYSVAFTIPLTVMLIGLYNENIQTISSGFSLLFLMFMSFIGSSIAEFKKYNFNLSVLKIIIPLFIISIATIIYSSFIDMIVLGCIFSLVIGIFSCFLLLHKKNN